MQITLLNYMRSYFRIISIRHIMINNKKILVMYKINHANHYQSIHIYVNNLSNIQVVYIYLNNITDDLMTFNFIIYGTNIDLLICIYKPK